MDTYGLKHLVTHLVEAGEFSKLYSLVEDPGWTKRKFVGTPWAASLVDDFHRASAVASRGTVEEWSRSIGYQLRRALIEELMSTLSDRAVLFLAKLGKIEQALDVARRNDWHRYRLMREIAKVVARHEPEKALSIIMSELATWEREGDPVSQHKSKLAAAETILNYAPIFLQQAQQLISEAREAEELISEADWLAYQADWLLPVVVLSGELRAAVEVVDSFPPLLQARALKNIARSLPDGEQDQSRELIDQALDILRDLEPTSEVVEERIRVLVTLLPLLPEDEQESALASLKQEGNFLQSIGAAGDADSVQRWTLQETAPINPSWTKRMLLESEWFGAQLSNGRELLLEIAKDDVDEALALLQEELSARAGSAETLAEIIGVAALQDVDQAEALIEEYEQQLGSHAEAAYLALAEAHLVQGHRDRAEAIFEEKVFSIETGGVIRGRCQFQLAILKHAVTFMSPEQAQSRLMNFPSPKCRDARRKARLILAHIAGRRGDFEFIEQQIHGEDARIEAVYGLTNYGNLDAAQDLIQRGYIAPVSEERTKLEAHIATLEAQADPTKLEVLLEHFGRNGHPHHLCPYMTRFPDALRWLVQEGQIDDEEAAVLIEEIVESLVTWQCSRQDGSECSCYERRDQVVVALIGIMAELSLERAEERAEALPSETMKLSALIQILRTQPDQQLLDTIVALTDKPVDDLWRKAQLFYDLAALLARNMPDAIRQLFALAEGIRNEAQGQRSGFRTGPNSTTFSIAKGRALARAVDNVEHLSLLTEAFEAVDALLHLEDKLRALDSLSKKTTNWPAEEQRVFLWHLWELSRTRKLADVQAVIALCVPMIEALGGGIAFWDLYEHVESAYSSLPLESGITS